MFKSTENRGFQLTFANGCTISVQWGAGNYCNNRNRKAEYEGAARGIINPPVGDCANAETWAWGPDGATLPGWEDVRGHQSADEVAASIAQVAALPPQT